MYDMLSHDSKNDVSWIHNIRVVQESRFQDISFLLAYLLPFSIQIILLGIMKHKLWFFKRLAKWKEKYKYWSLIFSCQRKFFHQLWRSIIEFIFYLLKICHQKIICKVRRGWNAPRQVKSLSFSLELLW